MKKVSIVLCLLTALLATACSHGRVNFQFDCDPVGKDPKTGKLISSCE